MEIHDKQLGSGTSYQILLKLPKYVLKFFSLLIHIAIFDALIQRDSIVIQKITIGNLYKPFPDVTVSPFSTYSLNSKTLVKKKENLNISGNKRAC